MVYPTQYSQIVIEVKYCACPTSELNGWVIFVGKEQNYGLSLKIAYVTGGHWVCFSSPPFSCFLMSFFPFLLFLFPLLPSPFSPSFHGLPSVSFLLCYTLLCFIPVLVLSPYPYHFLLPLLPVIHALFLSSTLLPLCPPLICIIFIRLFY